MTTNTSKGFSIRLKPELKEWVLKRSTENMRSMNAELNILLTAVKGQIEKQKERKQVI